MIGRALAWALGLALLVAACQGGGARGDGGDGLSGAGCNTVEIAAPIVHPVAAGAAMPAPAGGALVDGTYFLTSYDVYEASAAASTYRVVLWIRGADLQLAQLVDGEESHTSLALTTEATTFRAVYFCGPTAIHGSVLPYDHYTATPTALSLHGAHDLLTFTRQ
jgi:hypothetical protein